MHGLLLCDSVTICCCQEDTDLRIPVAFLKNLPALFSRNLWPPHQKYSRISLKVFFKSLVLKKNRYFIIWQEKKKRNFHIAKSCAILWLWQFLHGPPCRYFPRIILKLLLFWFLWGLRSLTCRCLLIFFRCKLLQKTFSLEVFRSWCRWTEKNSQYRSRFRGASWCNNSKVKYGL